MENNTGQLNKIFNSIDNKHQIEITIIDNVSWFNINKFDFDNMKTFLILLKDVMTYLKNNNIEYIKQYVLEEDSKFFNKSQIINLYDGIWIVNTKIENFIDEFVCVMGIKKM